MILTASYTPIKSIKYTPIMSKNPSQSYIKSIRNNNLLHCNVKIKYNNKSHTETLSELEKAINNAKAICAVETHQDCKIAWDIVEELSAAAANKKQKSIINDFNDIYLDLEPSFEDSDIFDI